MGHIFAVSSIRSKCVSSHDINCDICNLKGRCIDCSTGWAFVDWLPVEPGAIHIVGTFCGALPTVICLMDTGGQFVWT
jgi:hypothetical protein